MLLHPLHLSSALLAGHCLAVGNQQPLTPNPHPQSPKPQQDLSTQIPASQPPPSQTGNWLGWGGDVYNNHWASSDAIIDTSNVGSLVQTCNKKYDPGVSAAPLVVDGVAYYPTWGGLLIALDYRTCHTLWKTNITHIILQHKPLSPEQKGLSTLAARTTPVIDEEEGVLYVGTLAQALLLAIDRKTGKLIDALQLDTHPFAVLTQSPTFYQGRLFIGVSSVEEGAADLIPNYTCCSFTGSMHAASLSHGRLRLLWSVPMNPAGSNFSGSAIWGSQPAIDPIRSQVFIATGNIYSLPEAFEECQNQTANIEVIKQGLTTDPCLPPNVLQEAVVALDLETGRVNWYVILRSFLCYLDKIASASISWQYLLSFKRSSR
jgi:outer membrane protein assembly factor BamB